MSRAQGKTSRKRVVVLTGGPGGGKSRIVSELRERGFFGDWGIVALEEVASRLKEEEERYGGIRPKSGELRYQARVMDEQLAGEARAWQEAEARPGPIMILLDRGVFDVVAFLGEAAYGELLRDRGYSVDGVLRRYDRVVFVQSAVGHATDMEDRFSFPTPEKFFLHVCDVEARLDSHLTTHPWVRRVPWSVSWSDKRAGVMEAVASALC